MHHEHCGMGGKLNGVVLKKSFLSLYVLYFVVHIDRVCTWLGVAIVGP